MQVYTIGHGQANINDLLDSLTAHGVTHVMDVRSATDANLHPEYNPESIRLALLVRGIRYANMGESLGAPAHISLEDCDRMRSTDEYRAGFTRLMQAALDQERVLCLLGYDWRADRCPRSKLVGESLTRAHGEVLHIEGEHVVPHSMVMARLAQRAYATDDSSRGARGSMRG